MLGTKDDVIDEFKVSRKKFVIYARVELLVSHRAPPRVADRGMLARYGGYRGNKIPGADQNQYRCLAADRGICKG